MIDTNEGRQRKVDIFRGQCLNIAGELIAGVSKTIEISQVFELAQKLYDEGIERGWIKRIVDARTINKATGEVEEAGLKNPITEKDKLMPEVPEVVI